MANSGKKNVMNRFNLTDNDKIIVTDVKTGKQKTITQKDYKKHRSNDMRKYGKTIAPILPN